MELVKVVYIQVACHGNLIDNEKKASEEVKLLVSGDGASVVQACNGGTFNVDCCDTGWCAGAHGVGVVPAFSQGNPCSNHEAFAAASEAVEKERALVGLAQVMELIRC